jgi:hypothetical protein
MGGPVAELRLHSGVLEVNGNQFGEFTLILNNQDQGLCFGTHRSVGKHRLSRRRSINKFNRCRQR